MERSSTPGLIAGLLSVAERVSFVIKSTLSLQRRGGGDGGRVLGIVSPEDTNGFWCHVFFTQHLTHGAILLQSLHFNVHYDEVCQSNRLTIGHLDCPKMKVYFKVSLPFTIPSFLCSQRARI